MRSSVSVASCPGSGFRSIRSLGGSFAHIHRLMLEHSICIIQGLWEGRMVRLNHWDMCMFGSSWSGGIVFMTFLLLLISISILINVHIFYIYSSVFLSLNHLVKHSANKYKLLNINPIIDKQIDSQILI